MLISTDAAFGFEEAMWFHGPPKLMLYVVRLPVATVNVGDPLLIGNIVTPSYMQQGDG